MDCQTQSSSQSPLLKGISGWMNVRHVTEEHSVTGTGATTPSVTEVVRACATSCSLGPTEDNIHPIPQTHWHCY